MINADNFFEKHKNFFNTLSLQKMDIALDLEQQNNDQQSYDRQVQRVVFQNYLQIFLELISKEQIDKLKSLVRDNVQNYQILTKEEIDFFRDQQLPTDKSVFTPNEEINIKQTLAKKEIEKNLNTLDVNKCGEILDQINLLKIVMQSEQVTLVRKKFKIQEFLQQNQSLNERELNDLLIQAKKKSGYLNKEEKKILQKKIEEKQIDLTEEDTQHLQNTFKKNFYRGISYDTFIKNIQTYLLKCEKNLNSYEIIQIQDYLSQRRINCLSFVEIFDFVDQNLNFFELTSLLGETVEQARQIIEAKQCPNEQQQDLFKQIIQDLGIEKLNVIPQDEQNELFELMKLEEKKRLNFNQWLGLQLEKDLKKSELKISKIQNVETYEVNKDKLALDNIDLPDKPKNVQNVNLQAITNEEEFQQLQKELQNSKILIKDYKQLLKIRSIQINQLQYDNKLLTDELEKYRLRFKEISELQINTSDQVQYNFNNKQNYVNLLHEKIFMLEEDQIDENAKNRNLESVKIKFLYEELLLKYERVSRKLLQLNEENKTLNDIKKEHLVILPKSKIMWKMVLQFYEENKIDDHYFDQINIDEPDNVLERESDETIEEYDYDTMNKLSLVQIAKVQKNEIDTLEKKYKTLNVEYEETRETLIKRLIKAKQQLELVDSEWQRKHKRELRIEKKKFMKELDQLKNIGQDSFGEIQKQKLIRQMTRDFEQRNKDMVKENQDFHIKLQSREKEIAILKSKVKKFEKKYQSTLQSSKSQMNSMIQSNVNKSRMNTSLEGSRLKRIKKKESKVETSEKKDLLSTVTSKPKNQMEPIQEDLESKEKDDENNITIPKDQYEELKEDIEQLEELEMQFEMQTQQVENLQQQNEELQNEISELNDKCQELELQAVQNQEENQIVTKDLNVQKNVEQKYEEEIDKMQEKLDQLNEDNVKKDFEIKVLKKKNLDLEQENNENQEQFERFQEKIAKLALKESGLQTELVKAKKEKVLQKANHEQAVREVTSLKKEKKIIQLSMIPDVPKKINIEPRDLDYYFDRENRAKDDLISESELQQDDIQISNPLEKSVKKLILINSKLEKQLKEKDITMKELISETNYLKKEVTDLQNILEKKKQQYIQKFKNPNKHLYDENVKQRDQNLELFEKFEEANKNFKNIEKNKLQLEEEIEKLKDENSKKNEEISQREFEILELKKYKKIIEEIKNGSNKDLVNTKIENESLKETVQQLQEMVSNLQNLEETYQQQQEILRKNENLIKDKVKTIERLQQNINKEKLDIKNLQIDLQSKDKQINLNEQQLKELNNKLLNTEQGFDELKSVLYQQMEQKNPYIVSQVQSLETEKQTLKAQIKTLENQQRNMQQQQTDLNKILNLKEQEILEQKKNEDRLQKLRKLLKSRDIEILELVKDSNKKSLRIQSLEIQANDLELQKKDLEKVLELKEKEYTFKQEQSDQLGNEKYNLLKSHRIKNKLMASDPTEERLVLYNIIEQKNDKIEALQETLNQKFKNPKEHPLVRKLNNKVQDLEQKQTELEQKIKSEQNKQKYLKNENNLMKLQEEQFENATTLKDNEINKLIQNLKVQELETQGYQIKIDELTQQLNLQEEKLKQYQQSKKLASEDVKSLKIYIQNLENQNQQLKERLNLLKTELNQKDLDYDKLLNENEELQEELLKGQNDSLFQQNLQKLENSLLQQEQTSDKVPRVLYDQLVEKQNTLQKQYDEEKKYLQIELRKNSVLQRNHDQIFEKYQNLKEEKQSQTKGDIQEIVELKEKILQLQKEIKTLKNQLDIAQQKEEAQQELLKKNNSSILSLTQKIQDLQNLQSGQQDSNRIQKDYLMIKQKYDDLSIKLVNLKDKEDQIEKLNNDIMELQKELNELKNQQEEQNNEQQENDLQSDQNKALIQRLEKQLFDLKQKYEKGKISMRTQDTSMRALQQKNKELKELLDRQTQKNKEIMIEQTKIENELFNEFNQLQALVDKKDRA